MSYDPGIRSGAAQASVVTRRRIWLRLGVAAITAAVLAGVMVSAVDNVREAAARAH